ncbi:MAG: hypothetical protein JNJ88_04815 [Planctomycetes bacterium]|nr:hypothetical protein [Planctomycetota bacterium]
MSLLPALVLALVTQTASAPAGANPSALPLPSSADAQATKGRPRGSFREGVEALRAGRHAEALEILSSIEGEDPDGAPPELLWDKALAAFGSGDLHTSEASAEKAAARGGERFQRRRDFLRGNVGFRKAQALEQQIDSALSKASAPGGASAAAPLPDPAEYDKAIAQAEAARDAWIQAATGTGALESEHLDAARRNVERALLKIEELKKKKEELEKRKNEQDQQNQDQNKDQNKDQKKDQNQDEKPQSQPKDGKPESSPSDPKDSPQEQKPDEKEQKEEQPQQQPQGEPKELPQEQAQRLLDKLDEKEKQRREYMKARAKAVKVPKDW